MEIEEKIAEPRNIILSKETQLQKYKYGICSLICGHWMLNKR